jgi:hypothetical protein
MRPFLFHFVFWLAVLIAIGTSMQYWLSSQEEKCRKYCATEGMESDYHPPRVRNGVRFGRRTPARPGDCQCAEVKP